ncbi:hypothetical protein [Williamsia sp.]|uniref:hypothetical protein n=1 Tax=Williamsia sp. TaxID=1872085 RepID=UPI001A265152|nr:hypothetical protein [Williamsia sp.]MBJ7291577.1 hypothetical protein [Williamsia sp.]
MANNDSVTFRWTRHVEYGLVGKVMGWVLIPFGVLIAYVAGRDHAWLPCAIGVYMLALAVPGCLGPSLRVEAEKEKARVRNQPPLRDARISLLVPSLGYGAFLVERALAGDPVSTGYLVVGSILLVAGALLLVVRVVSRGDLLISQTRIDVPPRFAFSVDDDSASMQWGYRSDDMVILKRRKPNGRMSKTGLPYRLWGMHPNTVLSMIEQLREWNSESRVVDGKIIAAMAVIGNQKSVKKGESVNIPIDSAAAFSPSSGLSVRAADEEHHGR